MKYDLWAPKRRIETRYQKALIEMTQFMEEAIKGLTDPFEITARLRSLVKNMAFQRYAESAAMKMVTHLFTDAGRTWRTAARVNSQGRTFYEALRKEMERSVGGAVGAQIQRNAGIIRSLPFDIAKQVTDFIGEEALKGRRASLIAADIQERFPRVSENKAKLIARTEVSKTSTALTQARAENIGANWYQWRTSEDARVRDSHRIMEGVLINWADPPSPERLDGQKNPPSPYHAGEIYNCRCYPEPVISLDYVKFPHKVYHNGAIIWVTRSQFQEMGG